MAEYVPENVAQKICELCFENNGKYCCPRCNILFCSLDCYRTEKHSECSENFYRNLVHEDMLTASDESRVKMTDILKRLHKAEAAGGYTGGLHDGTETAYDDSDDDEVVDLQERLKDLDLDNADAVWAALTEDERHEFAAMISHGEIGHLMPDWEPWWMFTIEKRLVRDKKQEWEDKLKMSNCPEHKMVPDMRELTTVEPSKTIKYNISNVLASYAFTLRYFHGHVDHVEWTICFLKICNNMHKNTNFEDPALAVESVVQKCLQCKIIQTDKNSLDVMRYDTVRILQGPSEDDPKHFIKSALSHLYRILARARVETIQQPDNNKLDYRNTEFSKKFPEQSIKKSATQQLDADKLKKCLKKLKYYLSYVESYSMDFEEEEE